LKQLALGAGTDAPGEPFQIDMRIYLDICCFNRPFDDQSQLRIRLEAEAKLAIQEEIRSGRIELCWSYMMDFENEANPYPERRISIAQWRAMATADISESEEIIFRARSLNALGFGKKDALHLACAIALECGIFLSTDDRVIGKRTMVPDISILNPVDYVIFKAEEKRE